MIVSLDEKPNPKHTAVTIVDVQNDCCSPGGYMHRKGHSLDMVQEMLLSMQRLLRAAENARVPRIFFQTNYATSFNWYLSPVWLDRAQRANRRGATLTTRFVRKGRGAWSSSKASGRRTAQTRSR